MNADEFLSQVGRIFAYLLVDYGFHLVYFQAARQDAFIFGFESVVCRLEFVHADDDTAIMIGPPSSIFGEDEAIDSTSQWVNAVRVADFVEQRLFDWTFEERITDGRQRLHYWEQRTRSSWHKILPMFRDLPTVETWYQQFLDYGRVQIERQWGDS